MREEKELEKEERREEEICLLWGNRDRGGTKKESLVVVDKSLGPNTKTQTLGSTLAGVQRSKNFFTRGRRRRPYWLLSYYRGRET